jgi:hypothetical protein
MWDVTDNEVVAPVAGEASTISLWHYELAF